VVAVAEYRMHMLVETDFLRTVLPTIDFDYLQLNIDETP
jgi:hypothetical protein